MAIVSHSLGYNHVMIRLSPYKDLVIVDRDGGQFLAEGYSYSQYQLQKLHAFYRGLTE